MLTKQLTKKHSSNKNTHRVGGIIARGLIFMPKATVWINYRSIVTCACGIYRHVLRKLFLQLCYIDG